jgi:glycogen(starch) synthase
MANEERDREPREVKNHILFEIATEVAHRGMRAQSPGRTG